MQISVFVTARTSATRVMNNLDAILVKAQASAEARKIDPAVLLASRLAPDMFSLLRQVQLTSDFAKGPMARLAGIENPKFEDVETTFEELRARIARTLEFVHSIPESSFAGAEDRDITIQARTETFEFKGLAYLIGFALPNLYFHMSMAYAILRHNGVEIGKRDFIGPA